MTEVLDLPATTRVVGATSTSRAPRPLALACTLCGATHLPSPSATCEECLGPLEPV